MCFYAFCGINFGMKLHAHIKLSLNIISLVHKDLISSINSFKKKFYWMIMHQNLLAKMENVPNFTVCKQSSDIALIEKNKELFYLWCVLHRNHVIVRLHVKIILRRGYAVFLVMIFAISIVCLANVFCV